MNITHAEGIGTSLLWNIIINFNKTLPPTRKGRGFAFLDMSPSCWGDSLYDGSGVVEHKTVPLLLIHRREIMTKEKFLTVRWNNLLTLGLGIPGIIYIVVAFSSGVWSTRGGLIGLALIGVLY